MNTLGPPYLRPQHLRIWLTLSADLWLEVDFWLPGIWEQQCSLFSLVNPVKTRGGGEAGASKDRHCSEEYCQNHKMCFWLSNVYPRHQFKMTPSVYSHYGTCSCIHNKIYFHYAKLRTRCTGESNMHGSAYKYSVLWSWFVSYLLT